MEDKKQMEEQYNKIYKNNNSSESSFTDRVIMTLEKDLLEIMKKFYLAMQLGDHETMSQQFIKASEIERGLSYARAVQMKEKGLSYITNFGFECFSQEQLDYWNNLYQEQSLISDNKKKSK